MFSHFRKTRPRPPNYFVRDNDRDFPVTESYVNEGLREGWLTQCDIRQNTISDVWEYYYRVT
jgi:hypothetical protein